MKKQISNLGKTLSKKAQQQINGGGADKDCKKVGDLCGPSYNRGECRAPHPNVLYLACLPIR